MAYGEGERNKLEYARLLAASLSYLIIKQRDSAALGVFDWQWRAQLPPSSQMGHMSAVLSTLESIEPKDESTIGPLLQELADRIRRRGLIFILSDVFDEMDPFLKSLRHLRFMGHDVTLFHIVHPDEISFPFTGNVRFDGMEIPEELKTRPHLIRDAYVKVFANYLSELQNACDSYRLCAL
jgi:uncharacterized protein (DUF58 family)